MSTSTARLGDAVIYRGAGAARRGWLAVVAAGALTAGMFVLLPFSDLLTPPTRADQRIRRVDDVRLRRPPPVPRPLEPPPPAAVAPPAAMTPPPPVPRPNPAPRPVQPQVDVRLDIPLPRLALSLDMDFPVSVPPPAPAPMPVPPPAPMAAEPAPAPAPEPVAAVPAEPTEYDLAAVDRAPVLTHRTQPRYPAAARRYGTEGWVVVAFTVATDGRPITVRALREEPAATFGEAAVEAVHQWRFEPGLKDGRPVPTRVEVKIGFRLE